MDSGNSGSMQSSSGGGDEEYDSRGETLSPFFNPSLNFVGSISNHPQPPPQPPPLSHPHHNQQQQQQNHPPSAFFDLSPQNLGPFSHSPQNQNQNQNPNPNSNPNPNLLYNLDWSREVRSDHNPNYTQLGQSLLMRPNQGSSTTTMVLPSVDGNNSGVTGAPPRSDQTAAAAKNSRKRTRASRRAPTTVLTTDTSNFRQMVQEFTGIPAPPFSAASASPYSRLFASSGGGGTAALETLSYPFIRPSIQKLQPPPNANNFMASTSNTFQNQTLQNMENVNPILTFQNLLQSPLKYPRGNSVIPSIDDLGMTQNRLNQNLGGFTSHGNSGGSQMESVRNCSVSTSEFHHHPEKGLENVSSRNEGTVDSWVCPSD